MPSRRNRRTSKWTPYQRLEGELLTRAGLIVCKEAGVFNLKTLADQLRNRGAKRDDKDKRPCRIATRSRSPRNATSPACVIQR